MGVGVALTSDGGAFRPERKNWVLFWGGRPLGVPMIKNFLRLGTKHQAHQSAHHLTYLSLVDSKLKRFKGYGLETLKKIMFFDASDFDFHPSTLVLKPDLDIMLTYQTKKEVNRPFCSKVIV